jgi:hypothetical protein
VIRLELARFLRQEAERAEQARRVNPGPMVVAAEVLEAIDDLLLPVAVHDEPLPYEDALELLVAIYDLLHPGVTS